MDKMKAGVAKAVIPAVASGAFLMSPPAEAITSEKLNSLTYLQVKGTGLANRCPEVSLDHNFEPDKGLYQ